MGDVRYYRWLLLIHQLPKDPAYLRVKVGRRLASVGAISLKNSVYLLPRTDGCIEDFQWIRREITEGGGEATVVEAQLVEGLSDVEVESKFRTARDADYHRLAEELRTAPTLPSSRRKRPLSEAEQASALSELGRFERRLEEIATIDFFGATGSAVVAGLVAELRRRLVPPAPAPTSPPPATYQRRTWVTRCDVGIDRIASAWLIQTRIDVDAIFKFVPARGYAPAKDELRFDMFEAEFSHENGGCTFETLLQRFAITGAGLRAIAEVVHDIDVKDNKYLRPETLGVSACVTGLCAASLDDEQRLARGAALFEGLLLYFKSKAEHK